MFFSTKVVWLKSEITQNGPTLMKDRISLWLWVKYRNVYHNSMILFSKQKPFGWLLLGIAYFVQ